ncbi:MAG: hypothetical protein WBA74_23305 [Cyclobacteriaceae bacterium]
MSISPDGNNEQELIATGALKRLEEGLFKIGKCMWQNLTEEKDIEKTS